MLLMSHGDLTRMLFADLQSNRLKIVSQRPKWMRLLLLKEFSGGVIPTGPVTCPAIVSISASPFLPRCLVQAAFGLEKAL